MKHANPSSHGDGRHVECESSLPLLVCGADARLAIRLNLARPQQFPS
jgi:hypothetical protein